MSAAPIVLLGDPRLRVQSNEIHGFDHPSFHSTCRTLASTLDAFRSEYGFGRAISAPQIGVPLRLIAVNLGKGTFFVINPRIVGTSDEQFTMWDDCMSFPDLLVRLARHASISVEWVDREGRPQLWRDLDIATSELLQHEIDHLDGILAVDHAIDRDSLVLKAQYDANRELYDAQVDYTINGGKR